MATATQKTLISIFCFALGTVATAVLSGPLNHTVIPYVFKLLHYGKKMYIYHVEDGKIASIDERYDLLFPWGSTEPSGRMVEIGNEPDHSPSDYIVNGVHVSDMLAFSFKRYENTGSSGGSFVGHDDGHNEIYVGLWTGFLHNAEKGEGCHIGSRWAVIGNEAQIPEFESNLLSRMKAQDNVLVKGASLSTKCPSIGHVG